MAWRSEAVREISVYRSISNEVFSNLAFEDWILKNVNLSFRRILFLWRNSSCVVIGRHQNPWTEVNVRKLQEKEVTLARRRSGGGTVYHDLGNMNFTLFSSRQDYNRPRNLQLVCDAINQRWNISLQSNKKDDIVYNKWKVSGSSAKLLKDSAYHHFTLLLNVDMGNLHQLLAPSSMIGVSESKATASVRSEVTNLHSLEPTMEYTDVCSAVAEKFYDVHRVVTNRQIVDIDPTSESLFPGITEMKSELQAWDWVYSKTPKFKVVGRKAFTFANILLTMEIQHGVIAEVTVDSDVHLSITSAICNTLQGVRYWCTDIKTALESLTNDSDNELVSVCKWLVDLTC